MGGLGSVFLLDAAESGKVDGLVEVDEAFVVVVRDLRLCRIVKSWQIIA